MNTEFTVEQGDITEIASSVLLLKHAEGFYGADEHVVGILERARLCTREEVSCRVNDFAIVATRGVLAPKRVLFVGTPTLSEFSYEQILQFARRAVQVITTQTEPARWITTTVHGVNYGLDAAESLQSLVRGSKKVRLSSVGAALSESLSLNETSGRRAFLIPPGTAWIFHPAFRRKRTIRPEWLVTRRKQFSRVQLAVLRACLKKRFFPPGDAGAEALAPNFFLKP